MKNKSLLLAAFIIIVCKIHAQDYTFGIKGGVNYITIGELYHFGSPKGGNNVTPAEDVVYSPNKEMGTQFGAYIRLNYDSFYIQPEVLFTSSKSSYDLAKKTANWTQESMDIPVFFGYKFSDSFSVYGGPIISSINERNLEGTENTPYANWTYENSNILGGIGLKYQIGRFGVDLRYSYSFTKVEELRVDINRGIYGTNLGDLLEYNPSYIVLNAQIDIFTFGGESKKRKKGSNWRNHNNL